MSDATIIVGKLNDEELRKSIDSLVTHIKSQTDVIKSSFDGALSSIESKVKGLSSVKADNGVDVASTQRATQAVKERTQATKELNLTLDQQQIAMQKGTGKSQVLEQYDTQLIQLRERLAEVTKNITIYQDALASGNKLSLAPWYEAQLPRAKQEIEQLTIAIQKLEAQRANLRDVLSPGDSFKNYVNSLTKANPELALLNQQFKEGKSLLQQRAKEEDAAKNSVDAYVASVKSETQTQREAAREAKIHAEAIKELAAAAREQHKKGSYYDMGTRTSDGRQALIYPENDERAKGLTIEQQISQLLQENARMYHATTAELQKQLETEKAISSEYEKRSKYVKPDTSLGYDITSGKMRSIIASKLGIDAGGVVNWDEQTSSIKRLSTALKQYQDAYGRLTAEERNSPFGKQMIFDMQVIERNIKNLRKEMSRPISLSSAMSGSEKTLDDIAYKIQRLQSYKRGINITDPKQAGEIRQVDAEINRLNADLQKYMATTKQAHFANNALTRSWNYMKNRLAFYFTVGASTQFMRQLIDVRGQYEMNERALGVLVDSAERGTQIFNELSQMSLVSPYTLIELSAAAKQLVAYDVAAKDVVDTTRRLADMASAVGIPIERLTYALGQIKAYGYLNSRDNRMFANAGIPLVKELSEYYTELEGRLVSVADVYDRIKQKTVSYEDVVNIINKMTDEGGRFFDFQAKMAETLKVRLANLTLAWNNMLNAIGEESQGVIVGFLGVLRDLFVHWKDIEHIMKQVVLAFGAYKAYQIVTNALTGASARTLKTRILAMKAEQVAMLQKKKLTESLTASEERLILSQKKVTASDYEQMLSGKGLTKQKALLLAAFNRNNVALRAALVNMGLLTVQELKNITVWKAMGLAISSVGISLKRLFASAMAFVASNPLLIIAGVAFELYHSLSANSDNIKDVNRSLVDNAKETFDSISEYVKNSERIYKGLYEWDGEGGKIIGKRNLDNNEAVKAWEEMRGQIELTSNASNIFLATLEAEADVNERLRKGFDYLQDIQDVAGIIKNLNDDAIKVSQTTLYGLFGEGLKDDLKDYEQMLEKIKTIQTDFGEAIWKEGNVFKELVGELKVTTDSIFDVASNNNLGINEQRELFERAITMIAQKSEMSAKQTRIIRMEGEELYYKYAKSKLEEQLQYQSGAQRAATIERLKELENEFGQRKDIQQEFFTWLSETNGTTVKNMLRDLSEEEIKHGDWLKGQNAKWVEEMAKKFSTEYGISFDKLRKMVLNASTWSINIRVFFDFFKPLSDVAKDFVNRVKNLSLNPNDFKQFYGTAESQVDIIKSLKDEVTDLTNKMKTAEKAGGEYWNKNKKEWGDRKKNLTDIIHAYGALTAEEEKEQKKTGRGGGTKKDPLGDALAKQVQLITDMQKRYKEFRQIGVNTTDALRVATSEYGKTLSSTNAILNKFGIATKTNDELAKMDLRALRDYFNAIKGVASTKGSAKGLEAIEKALASINVEITKADYTKIVDGLNSELGKLKEEYELGVELSTDPEMGDMFAKAFNIDVEALPKSFGEALDMANKIVKDKLKELKIDIHNFGLLDTLIEPDMENKWAGLDFNSKPVQDLIKLQKTWRDMFTNIMKENEKVLDDYVKKYGNYSDRVAELEADRLEKIKRLNDRYREDQRSDPDYKANMAAIEQGTSKELGRLRFEEFKNSHYYVAMFEDIEHASSSALSAIRDRLSSLKDSLNELSPEQMKWVVQQYEKINQELLSRNPFKGLAGNVKNYIEALKKGGDAQEKFLQAQDEYDAQLKQVTMWKTILKLRERGTRIGGKEIQHISKMSSLQEDLVSEYVAENDINNMSIDQIKGQVTEADKLLQTLYEILQVAQANNDKFNYAKKILKDQGVAIAKAVGQNLQSLGELRDFITQDLGIEISAELDGMVDGLTKTGEGVNKIVSSLENADFVGALVGVGQVFYGLYDTVASIFGEGSAREKRITRQIEESERAVKRLENTYKSLEHTASNAYGAMTSGASYATKANKELQLVELQRQLVLEKSRKKKKQDQDKIIELEGQIMDLKNELNDATRDIVNDLLGISSAGDGIENLVSVMIEAFRNGEDAMEAFGKEWDKMIDNMILKLIVSTFMQKEWDKIMAYLNKREEEMLKSPADAVQKAQAEYDKIAAMSDAEIARIINPLGSILGGKTVTPQQIKDYREAAKKALTESTEVLNKASYDYTKWTMEYMNTEGRAQMTSMAELLKNSLGDWYTFGENNAKDLSALQAGIQGITEETAGALEAYMNSISQQVYLQSNILTQIRDAVLAIDHNAQTATQAEMLLQLQNNYILMQTMQSMMENWTVPSGQGIRVELMS